MSARSTKPSDTIFLFASLVAMSFRRYNAIYNPQNESCAISKTKRSSVGANPKNEMVSNHKI